MARRGENIYLRKDGRYEGRYIKARKPDGQAVFGFVYGKKYAEVKNVLNRMKTECADGLTELAIQKNCSFADWMQPWLEHFVRPQVKQSTYENYLRQTKLHILPTLGDVALENLNALHIQNIVNKMTEKNLSSGTISQVYRLTSAALNAACEKDLIKKNVCVGIKKPKPSRREPRILTLQEQQRLERAAIQNGRQEFLFCLYTGLRLGELCALRWRDIRLEEGTVTICNTLKRVCAQDSTTKTRLQLDTPKTASSQREIPLPSFLTDLLREYKSTSSDDTYVFPGPKGGHRDPRTMQQQFTSFMKQLKIEGVHFHSLRHTFATRCLESNFDIKTLSAILGHSSPRITLEFYSHCTKEQMRSSMERLQPVYHNNKPSMSVNDPVRSA